VGKSTFACFRTALALDPKDARHHDHLGNALRRKGKVDEAIACYQKAIELEPKLATAHTNLGAALYAKGQLDEAIACFQKVIELDPKFVYAHYNLGNTLRRKGQVDEAIACYQKAIELDPKLATAHTNLGAALTDKGQVDEAIACFRKALALDPKDALPHNNLGITLRRKGQVDEAIACFQKAIELDPKFASAHNDLGEVLNARGKVDEAIACFEKAIQLAPSYAKAHCNLGLALKARGDFALALMALRRGHELGSKRSGWRYPSDVWVRDCERLVEREKQLLDVLAGKSRPADAKERLEWATLSVQTRRYVAAARLSSEAFQADGKLADDLEAGHRYRAAVAATQAGLGLGRDAGGLTNEAKAALRKQALDWLQADLAAWRKHGEASKRAAALRRWRADEALAGARDAEALANLPEVERAAWRKLWAEVDALQVGTDG
jgi:tetratricopeptide (TPR) repeat protein